MKLMKSFAYSLMIFIALGCADPRSQSRENLIKLTLGMTKQQVSSVMGTETVTDDTGVKINRPYKTSMYKSKGDQLEIWYYVTDHIPDGTISNGELTPLVFINGILDSWGWESWVEKAKRYDINVNYKLN